MTALPDHRTPLTAAEYAALPEDSDQRVELQEGWLMMSPRPVPDHQNGVALLQDRLRSQIPDHTVLHGVDVDLELAPPDRPGTVRVPDLVVVHRSAFDRVRRERNLLRAGEVVLAVEVLSPGSTRIDTLVKHHEYAAAGIPHYWMVDLDDGPSLTVCHLAGESGYQDAAPERGVLVTDVPFPLQIDVAALLG